MELKATSNMPFETDFDEIIRSFAPSATLAETSNIFIEFVEISPSEYEVILTAKDTIDRRKIAIDTDIQRVRQRAMIKRLGKVMLYDYVSKTLDIALPYGSLTGIRPTKLYHEELAKGIDVKKYFCDELRVDSDVVDFLGDIVGNQASVYSQDTSEIDLFVNIPICVSRCSYCSFISAEYGKIKSWIAPYVAQLVREIKHARELIIAKGYTLRAIYVGGGTPTSLSEEEFRAVMVALKGLNCREFTVEAGRPDTITREKLATMNSVGVTRISINPQTFNDETLVKIGRLHTSADIEKTYAIAREFDFDINMDLIAMLPDETLEMFQKSVLNAIKLAPENITVHTLAIKRGSKLQLAHYDNQQGILAKDMVGFSKKALKESGYKPYYMYKQKYMSGNLENTGYMLGDKACLYNIDIMEETHSILACGAGGISKRNYKDENRLERLANPKGIDIYLEREAEILSGKEKFFE